MILELILSSTLAYHTPLPRPRPLDAPQSCSRVDDSVFFNGTAPLPWLGDHFSMFWQEHLLTKYEETLAKDKPVQVNEEHGKGVASNIQLLSAMLMALASVGYVGWTIAYD